MPHGGCVNTEPEHAFDHDYWERHWRGATSERAIAAHPYVGEETADLTPGTALDAGSGAGAESIWLAERGWQVTGTDISRTVLAAAAERSRHTPSDQQIEWVEADLARWEPAQQWNLVLTSYAHPSIPQLDFYRRIGGWVAPGGTLLIVAHLHDPSAAGHQHPREASVTRQDIVDLFGGPEWRIETAREHTRRVGPGGMMLNDVIVRVRRDR